MDDKKKSNKKRKNTWLYISSFHFDAFEIFTSQTESFEPTQSKDLPVLSYIIPPSFICII